MEELKAGIENGAAYHIRPDVRKRILNMLETVVVAADGPPKLFSARPDLPVFWPVLRSVFVTFVVACAMCWVIGASIAPMCVVWWLVFVGHQYTVHATPNITVSIDGLIGVGKSTLVRMIGKFFNSGVRALAGTACTLFEEKVNDFWLQAFYTHPRETAFPFQIERLTHTIYGTMSAYRDMTHGRSSVAVIDRSTLGNLPFAIVHYARGSISPDEFMLYVQSLVHKSPYCVDVAIHLDADIHTVHDRIKVRDRNAENGLPLDYLVILDEAMAMVTLYAKYRYDYPVVVFDWTILPAAPPWDALYEHYLRRKYKNKKCSVVERMVHTANRFADELSMILTSQHGIRTQDAGKEDHGTRGSVLSEKCTTAQLIDKIASLTYAELKDEIGLLEIPLSGK